MAPKQLKIEKGRLVITWNDDSQDSIGLEYLRNECPCAGCKGETILLRSIRPPKLLSTEKSMFSIAKIEQVGGYAVKISWKDGHDTGIYNWEYLRELARDENDNKEHNYKPLI